MNSSSYWTKPLYVPTPQSDTHTHARGQFDIKPHIVCKWTNILIKAWEGSVGEQGTAAGPPAIARVRRIQFYAPVKTRNWPNYMLFY